MSRPAFDELAGRLAAFARERDWDQFHSPKNLAMALVATAVHRAFPDLLGRPRRTAGQPEQDLPTREPA